jgi:hypothetical protein
VDEAEAVLARFDRIDRLRSAGAPADALLEELRELLHEAEEWSRLEGGDDARRAVGRLRVALERDVSTEVSAV